LGKIPHLSNLFVLHKSSFIVVVSYWLDYVCTKLLYLHGHYVFSVIFYWIRAEPLSFARSNHGHAVVWEMIGISVSPVECQVLVPCMHYAIFLINILLKLTEVILELWDNFIKFCLFLEYMCLHECFVCPVQCVGTSWWITGSWNKWRCPRDG